MITTGTKLKIKMSYVEQDMAQLRDQYPDFYRNALKKAEESWFIVEKVDGSNITISKHHLQEGMYAGHEPQMLSMAEILTMFDVVA